MKLIIDVSDEEYITLSKISEKEKVNELSYYERLIANGIPYEERPQGEWITNDYLFQYVCSNCGKIPTMYTGYALSKEELKEYRFCRFCGADMRKGGTE